MATKTARIEARLTHAERKHIERGAALAGKPVSSFVVAAALQAADDLVREQATTVVPGNYFDRLASSLDEIENAPALKRAADAARRRGQIRAA